MKIRRESSDMPSEISMIQVWSQTALGSCPVICTINQKREDFYLRKHVIVMDLGKDDKENDISEEEDNDEYTLSRCCRLLYI